ncbi:MAG: hypothetical protein HN348_35045, partial [Proteobacteria bacterium]|nr:hypothetical protein [Pseudomonadota bacterium]
MGTALRHGDDLERLLVRAIESWSECPCVELAQFIEGVSKQIGGQTPVTHQDWCERDARHLPDVRGPLLATITSGTMAEAKQRMELVSRWPADPRVTATLAQFVVYPPYLSKGAFPFWRLVFGELRRRCDPAVLATLQERHKTIGEDFTVDVHRWIGPQLRRTVEVLKEAWPMGPPSAPNDVDDLLGMLVLDEEKDPDRLLELLAERPDDQE